MFYPQAMTEVELIVPEKDLLAVTHLLSGQGVFHQADGNYLNSDKDNASANPWQERASIYAGLERRIQSIMQTLGMEEGAPPAVDPKASPVTGVVDIEKIRPVVEQIELSVKKASEQIAAEHKRLEQSESTIKQLEPVADIDLDISALRNPRYLFSMLGMIPLENIDRLQVSLSRIPFVFLSLRQDNKRAVVWLAGARNNADILERAARSAYLNPLALPDSYQGTPTQIITSLQAGMRVSQEKIDTLKTGLEQLRKEHETQLQQSLWAVRSSRMLTDAIVRYGRLRYTYLIVGWIVSAGLEELTQKLQQLSKETLIETFPSKRDGARQDVPVALNTSGVLRPFQSMVTNYGRPRYDELDPTILMALTFPLLFGAMFGDIGHGAIVAFLGWLVSSRKVKALRGIAGIGGLVLACGLVSVVFGFLYGSLFGMEELEWLHPLWIQPTKNIMSVLIVAIGMGVVLLSLGFGIGIFNAWKRRDWGRVWVDPKGVAGLVMYWSLIGMGLSMLTTILPVPSIVFIILTILSGTVVMFSDVFKHLISGHRPLIEDGIATYGIQAFFELFETTIGFLSNSLSYVRVGAFAVAHGFLSGEIFILAAMAGPEFSFGWFLVVILGTVFVVGFEGLIVGIQTMRLEYYEFFSKFFTGGGVRYEPLSLQPNAEK
jgi:V/A-type H+-transporting ATPase subunit I